MSSDNYDKYCINCWSGPRCCSTSLMYSFAQRSDTKVLDEPLYASYLHLTGVSRPYTDLVMAVQDKDGNRVVESQILAPRQKKVLYAKHIGKQKVGIRRELFERSRHVILVRDPYPVIQSFAKVLEPTLQELGYAALVEIMSDLRTMGRPPVVVLSDDVVEQPEGTLRALCAALELDFDPAMLRWEAGPKPYDGPWARWWYGNTHKSTGFDRAVREEGGTLPEKLRPVLGECWPLFEMIRRHAIRPLNLSLPRPVSEGKLHPAEEAAAMVMRFREQVESDSESGYALDRGGGRGGSTASSMADGQESKKPAGSHVYVPDPRNENILIGIRDGITKTMNLVWRPQACVSVFDSAFMLGDGVWEGLRLHQGVLVFINEHLDRLYEGAKALDMDIGMTPGEMKGLIRNCLMANGMAGASDIHIRLMVSRGLKPTPYQNPKTTLGSPTIVIIPEYKKVDPELLTRGLKLFTTHVRRGRPDVQDPMWNSHSKLNCIAACIQANYVGADEALMLDPDGFVATCNSTNFFCVRKNEVWAPTTKYQLHGITRSNVLRACREAGMTVRECDFTLTEVYSADEAFVTGTFAGVVPVKEVDGRRIGSGGRGPVTELIQQLYKTLVEVEVEAIMG